jgi:hypothetical protein
MPTMAEESTVTAAAVTTLLAIASPSASTAEKSNS